MSDYKRNNRIAEALAMKGWKQVDLVERTGIKKSSINGWVKQNWQPKQKALMDMARVLGVSEMWLAGYDVPMERPQAQIKNDELVKLIMELKDNEELRNLCMSISHLTDDQRKTIGSMVTELSKLNTLH
ncbi:MAG: helix-turn-helix transcriptional regulator [Lachnospiraceae bacterium]|nr:helix-turn-helix transcriptional regulator [Lachnospiraceae bacterium]